tara:strand:+ start:4390 stop:4581 length:192 start_codon:yes stop_codon:yes gene_type:complete
MGLVKTTYNIGDIVFLTTDVEQRPRIITEIHINPNGYFYTLTHGIELTNHYEIEMSPELTFLN